MSDLTCILCGTTSHDVADMLIRWKGDIYGYGPHCRDKWTCYLNVKAQDEKWLLADIPERPPGAMTETEYLPW